MMMIVMMKLLMRIVITHKMPLKLVSQRKSTKSQILNIMYIHNSEILILAR